MRHRDFLRFATLFLLSFMLSGCMHYTHKSAEGKPDSDVATINLIDKSLSILKVDDDGTLFWVGRQYQYFIGPGAHRIKVWKDFAIDRHSIAVERNIELLAGHTYGLYGATWGGAWDFQVRDVKTGLRADIVVPPVGTSAAAATH